MESHHDDIEKLSQHYLTSSPVQHTNLRPSQTLTLYTKKVLIYRLSTKLYTRILSICANLIPSECKALEDLASNNNIIKSADKRDGIVIQDKRAYILQATRLLSDYYTYKKKTPQRSLPILFTGSSSITNTALSDGIITKIILPQNKVFKKHYTFIICPRPIKI